MHRELAVAIGYLRRCGRRQIQVRKILSGVCRIWRTGLLRTVRGTMDHRVRDLLPQVRQPTLLVVGREDRIVDPRQAIAAARRLPRGQLVVLPRCGHAPQIEIAPAVNRLVVEFLTQPLTPANPAPALTAAAG